MNSFMRTLVVSCASIMMITSYGSAEQQCVRPVQGFVSLGVCGEQSKFEGTLAKFNKLLDATTLYQLSKLSGGKFEIKGVACTISKDDLKKVVKINIGGNKSDNFNGSDGKIEMITAATVVPATGNTHDQVNVAAADYEALVVNPELKVTVAEDGQSIEIVNTTGMSGKPNEGTVMPKYSKYHNFYYDNSGTVIAAGQNFGTPDDSNLTKPDGTAQDSLFDEYMPAPTISNTATIDYDLTKLPNMPENAYQITLTDASNSSSSLWTGKKWQMAGFANLGLLVNFSQGGAWYLSVFASKPFVNHTQTITFGDSSSSSSSSSSNSDNGIEAKDKWSLGVETGLRCNITDKVYLGIGGGVQWSWYEFSCKYNGSNTTSETLKQDMNGTAPFMKLSLGFNINKHFGVEVFGKYTGKHDLKYKDSNKSSDNNSSNSGEWPIGFTKQGSPQFGIAASFKF